LTARDLITTAWSALDQRLEATSNIVSALADLLDEEKKRDLLASWNGFKIEVRLFGDSYSSFYD
jgi:E3 ubiquitin-protein ligase ZNF598